jgi:hypothetical protein
MALKSLLLAFVKCGAGRLAIVPMALHKARQTALMSKFRQLQTRIQSA